MSFLICHYNTLLKSFSKLISAPHLSQADLFALPIADEQQQAAHQQLLLQGETLSL